MFPLYQILMPMHFRLHGTKFCITCSLLAVFSLEFWKKNRRRSDVRNNGGPSMNKLVATMTFNKTCTRSVTSITKLSKNLETCTLSRKNTSVEENETVFPISGNTSKGRDYQQTLENLSSSHRGKVQENSTIHSLNNVFPFVSRNHFKIPFTNPQPPSL